MSSDDPSTKISGGNNMTIAVRVRPLLPKEIAIAEKENAPHPHCVTVDHEHNTVIVEERRLTVDLRPYVETRGIFPMDYAFDESSKNTNVYVTALRAQLINAIKNNERLACFVFGSTGSGKSFTMLGAQSQHGLFSLAVRDILGYGRGMELYFSFYELFNGKAYDLLNERAALLALEDGKQTVHLKGLSEYLIEDEDSFLELMHQGSQMRSQGSTHANENSSRSHAVALLNLTKKTTKGTIKVMSRFTFIDLAGSERGRDTLNTQNERHKEGAAINRSLLAVKECVRALHSGNQHVPFRGSKLTQVLRESLSGKCATVMIAMVSPYYKHVEDTVNALKYTSMLRQATNSSSSNHVSPQINTSLITNGGKEHANNNNSSLLSSPNSQQNTLILSSITNNSSTNPNNTNNNNNQNDDDEQNRNNLHHYYVDIECCSKCGYPIYAEDGIPHSCPKSSIRCPHCQMGVMKRNFEAHLAECPEITAACQFCHLEMKKRDIEKHENTICQRSFAICNQCQQKIQPKSAMQQHMAENCLAAKWMCPYCKIVTSKRNAEDHQTNCAARLVNCENCGFKVRSNHLKQHKRVCVGTRRLDEIMEQEVYSPKMLVPMGTNLHNNASTMMMSPNNHQKQPLYEFTKVVVPSSSPRADEQNQNQTQNQQQQQKIRGISKPPTLAHLKVPTNPGLAALLENNNNKLQQQQQQLQEQLLLQQNNSSNHSRQQHVVNPNQRKKLQQEIDDLIAKLPRSLSPGASAENIHNPQQQQQQKHLQQQKLPSSKPIVNHIQKNKQNAKQAQTARTTSTTTTAVVTSSSSSGNPLLNNNVDTSNNSNRLQQQQGRSPLPHAPPLQSQTARAPQLNNNNNSQQQQQILNNKNTTHHQLGTRSPSTPQHQISKPVPSTNNNNHNQLLPHHPSVTSPPPPPPQPPALSPMHVSECQFCHEHFLDNVLQKHIEHECMSVKVPCPFSDAGCKHLVERRNLAAHLNENVGQHLVMLHSFTQHVEAENISLKQRLSDLEHSKKANNNNHSASNSKSGIHHQKNNNSKNLVDEEEDVAAASTSLMILQQQQQQMMSSAQIAAALQQARLTKRNSINNNSSSTAEGNQQQQQQQGISDDSSSNNNKNLNSKPKLKSTRQQLQHHNGSPSMTVEKKGIPTSITRPQIHQSSVERFETPNRNDSFRFKNNGPVNHENDDDNEDDDDEETKIKYRNDDSAFDDEDDDEDDDDEDSLSGEIVSHSSRTTAAAAPAIPSTTAVAPVAIKIHAIPQRRSTSPLPMGLSELLSDDDDDDDEKDAEQSTTTTDRHHRQQENLNASRSSSKRTPTHHHQIPKLPNPHEDGVFDEEDEQQHSSLQANSQNSNNGKQVAKSHNNAAAVPRAHNNASAMSGRTSSSHGGGGANHHQNRIVRKYSKQSSEMIKLSTEPVPVVVVASSSSSPANKNTTSSSTNNQQTKNIPVGVSSKSSSSSAPSPPQIAKTNKHVVVASTHNNNKNVVAAGKKK